MASSNQAGQTLAIVVAAAAAAGIAIAIAIEATPHGGGGRHAAENPRRRSRKNPMRRYNVRLHGKIIDSVFQSSSETTKKEREADVKRSLVNHDGYDSGIVVVETSHK